MRVNLIESLEPGSFSGLSNLERMSLAGNFLRDSQINADRWTDLKYLTQLDLGWNEIKVLCTNSFGPEVGNNLHILSLRSNEKLIKVAHFFSHTTKQMISLLILDRRRCVHGT